MDTKQWRDQLVVLREPKRPWIYVSAATEESVANLPLQLKDENDPAVRILRGRKMSTGNAAFDEMGAAIQFPYYFGANWNAVIDCLRDLAWMPAPGYLFVVTAADRLFNEDHSQWESLVAAIEQSGQHWSGPIERGEWWDRPARPFHFVFQAEDASITEVADILRSFATSGVGTI